MTPDEINIFIGKKKSKLPGFTFFILAILFIALIAVSYDAYRFLNTPAEQPGQHLVFTVEQGATFDQVAADLEKVGAITNVWRFKLLAKYKKALGAIKAGDFLLDTNWTPDRVLHQLTKGSVILSTLVFREGLAWWQVAREIERQGFIKYSDFVEVIHDPEFLKAHAIPFETAEGFLFPDTYHLSKPKKLDKEQSRKIASMLIKTFWRKNVAVWKRLPRRSDPIPEGYGKEVADIGKGLKENPPLLPMDPINTIPTESKDKGEESHEERISEMNSAVSETGNIKRIKETLNANTKKNEEGSKNKRVYTQNPSFEKDFVSPDSPAEISPEPLKNIIILGSIVERETGVPQERARVAGVYINRIAKNMLLQCDPTVIYGVGPSFVGPIKRSQLQDSNNPYNTYKRSGLPPGPIGSMGVLALQAALMPEVHNFIFFVATGKGRGHTFSKTLKEHNRAVYQYRLEVRH